MIGNDIVDIELARRQSNWQRKGFLQKIFTCGEQQLIFDSENPEIMVWSLWSRKEAAYKIFNRQTNLRLYNPLQFECSSAKFTAGFYSGIVKNGDSVYFSKTEITKAFIHTVATTNMLDFERIFPLPNTDGVEKTNGVPFRYNGLKLTKRPVSISHHGSYSKIISI